MKVNRFYRGDRVTFAAGQTIGPIAKVSNVWPAVNENDYETYELEPIIKPGEGYWYGRLVIDRIHNRQSSGGGWQAHELELAGYTAMEAILRDMGFRDG